MSFEKNEEFIKKYRELNTVVEEKEKYHVKELEDKIKKLYEDNEELRKCLRSSNERVVTLESERNRLIESISKLDDELSINELNKAKFTNSV
jgi:hypothetical protein